MTTYNLGDFYPRSGQEINSSGNPVNPADSVDTNGNQGVIVNGTKRSFHQIQQTISLNVAITNGTQQVTITPTAGTIGRLRYLGAYAPGISGATSGAQFILVTVGTNINYGAYQVINKSAATTSSVSVGNADNIGAVPGLIFTSSNPLVITFQNTTNVAQTGTGAYSVIWEEETVA